MTPSDEIKRAEQANWLMNDPLLQEIFAQLEEDTTETWKTSKDRDLREECWKLIQAINLMKLKLRAIADNGQLVAARLERREREAHA